LVDSLPDKEPKPEKTPRAPEGRDIDFSKWKQIGRLTSVEYAEMVKEALEQSNIRVVIFSNRGHFGRMEPDTLTDLLQLGF
jgi:hypothetical protein